MYPADVADLCGLARVILVVACWFIYTLILRACLLILQAYPSCYDDAHQV
jgi:hypothetical protein